MARSSRTFSAFDHFLALCFGQLTYRESLRDIVTCLSARPELQYHLGFRGRVTRTNFAYANQHRDWRVFAGVAQILMRRAARLYQNAQGQVELPELVFALDASIIDLSLKLFPWLYYARSKGSAVKLHTLLSLKGNLPAWAAITEADFADQKILDQLPVQTGAYYILDRGYLDFTRLIRFERAGAFFIVRSKCHVSLRVIESRAIDKKSGLRCDQVVRLRSSWSRHAYPNPLRKIRYRDGEHQRSFVFLTNNFELEPETICALYRSRWQIELFFKWIKQHLKIRGFFGRSENAIRSQIWTAICSYLLVAIAKKQHQLPQSLYEILQVLSVSAFEQIALRELLTKPQSDHSQLELPNLLELSAL